MSSAAHNGADDIAFYEAAIGHTYQLDADDSGVQLGSDAGPLPSGRYLIQAFNLSAGGVCWVHVGGHGQALGLVAGAGRNRIPLTRETILAVETHVRKGDSDTVGAICTAGATATVWITRVSTKSGEN